MTSPFSENTFEKASQASYKSIERFNKKYRAPDDCSNKSSLA